MERRGVGVSAQIAMALLVCGCVFFALAGPAESLHTRTEALQQTFAGLGNITKAVQANAALGPFSRALAQQNGGEPGDVTTGELDQQTKLLAGGLRGIPLPLGPGGWTGLTSKPLTVRGHYAASAQAGAEAPPKIEVLYRGALPGYATLTAGRLSPVGPLPADTLAVSVTGPTAARFGLRPGAQLTVGGVRLLITGIVRVKNPGSTFWDADPLAAAPSFNSATMTSPSYWIGSVLTDPDQLAAMQNLLGGGNIMITWMFPLALGGINADQAQALETGLQQASTAIAGLPAAQGAVLTTFSVSVPLMQPLQAFIQTQTAVLAVLLPLFVSLIVVGVAVITLAARMLVARREDELRMLRARGAAGRQLAGLLLRDAALAAIPAAAAGAVLARLAVPSADVGIGVLLGWPLAVFALAVGLAGPPVIAVWLHRKPAAPANPARILTAETKTARFSVPALRRLIAEFAACAAAIAALVVLHDAGTQPGGGTNWFLTLTPVLLAIPAVVITLRLYPVLIRGLLRLARRRARATSYIALTSSARTSLASAGPAFTLVLALTLATFAGMVNQTISRGQVASSWQTTGADAVISAGNSPDPVTPAVQRAIAAVPGVQRATAIWHSPWLTSAGQYLTLTAVDPAGYAALTRGTPFPAIPAGLPRMANGVFQVIASPGMAAALGPGTVRLTSQEQMGTIRVRVASVLSADPAGGGGSQGQFVLIPLMSLPSQNGRPVPDQILLTGAGISRAQLAQTLARVLPGATTTYRSDVLAELTDSPLQHGATGLMLLTVFAAAGLGLLNLILGLALGATERDLTLARLTVMGHAHDNRFILAETLPAVLAASVAGVACALALPWLIGSALDLSVFTGSAASVQLTPDLAAVGLPVAGLILLAAVTLITQAKVARRRGLTSLLRAAP
jgi:putative ABC transport system permease protein